MIYHKAPNGFVSKFEIVSCYMECGRDILLLHRRENKSEGDRWGVPAGKQETNENRVDAIIREIKEETSCQVPKDQLKFITTVYVTYPEYHFIYHIFRVPLSFKPAITINQDEHKAYQWVEPGNALQMNLVRELDACIKMQYKIR